MPRAVSSYTAIVRQRASAEIVPLVEVTAYAERFHDVGRQTYTFRFSDRDRVELGQEWHGVVGNWGDVVHGLARNTALDMKMDNLRRVPALLGGVAQPAKRLTDWFRVGLNRTNVVDPAFWDAKLYLLFKSGTAGGSGDELWWARLILEEPTGITEDALVLRWSGPELFLEGQDGGNLNPSSIIAAVGTGSAGAGPAINPTVTFTLPISGGFRYLALGIINDNTSLSQTNVVTCAGVPMTLALGRTHTLGGTRVEWWELVDPPVGASQTVSVSFTEPAAAAHKVLIAVALVNVLQGQPRRGLTGTDASDSNPRVLPTSERGDRVLDFAGYYFGAGILPGMTVGALQTQLINRTDGGNPGSTSDFLRFGSSHQLGDAGSILMDWTIDGGASRDWVSLGASLQPAT